MTHRTARELLLEEAKDAPVDVWSVEGIRGHLASLEASANGPARIIRVSHEGSEVCTMFMLGPGEPRPQFYPEDVPFLEELGSVVAWDKDGGLHVSWSIRLTETQKTEIKERMAKVDFTAMPEELRTLGEQMQGKTKEEMKDMMRDMRDNLPESVTDWSKQLFGDSLSAGLPDYLLTGLANIVSFHEEAGWTAERREGKEGPFMGFNLRRGSVERLAVAVSVMGFGRLDLMEPAPDADS